jgi:hypothetical protein
MGVLLRNQLYAGIVDVPEYGVRGQRGDFEPYLRGPVLPCASRVLRSRAKHGTAAAARTRTYHSAHSYAATLWGGASPAAGRDSPTSGAAAVDSAEGRHRACGADRSTGAHPRGPLSILGKAHRKAYCSKCRFENARPEPDFK